MTIRGWLQPSLLDRLTDDRPDQKVGPVRVLSPALLKARVQEELSSLLNATNFESVEELSAYPAVMETSLNYGIRDLTGRTRSGISASELERGVEEAIVRFEPRIIRETLKVSCSTFATSTGRTSLEIRIEGDLRCRPLPEALRLRTLLNLEDGEAVIEQE